MGSEADEVGVRLRGEMWTEEENICAAASASPRLSHIVSLSLDAEPLFRLSGYPGNYKIVCDLSEF